MLRVTAQGYSRVIFCGSVHSNDELVQTHQLLLSVTADWLIKITFEPRLIKGLLIIYANTSIPI